MKKIIYIGFAFEHHKGTHGGYHHLANYINYDYIVDCQKEIRFFSNKNLNFFMRCIRKIIFLLLGNKCPFAMLKCLFISLCNKEAVFHIIYGENIFLPLFFKLKRKNHKVIYTIHQPFEWFENSKQGTNILTMPDKIIILSTNEISKFQKIAGKEKIIYIPHGIYTDYYHPDSQTTKNGSILLVGNWLRDFNLALSVFKEIKKHNPNQIINIVGQPQRKAFFKDLTNYYSGISDEELLKLYQQSSILYLPLVRFTANNALLEAASTGCNIIIATNNITDNTYIPSTELTIINRELQNNVNTITSILKQPQKTNEKLRDYIIKNYDWKQVSKQIKELYHTI